MSMFASRILRVGRQERNWVERSVPLRSGLSIDPESSKPALHSKAGERDAEVGTNDLAMYILAADRDASHLASMYDPLHPAVIRTLRTLTELACETESPLSICGEIASDPSMTAFLVGLGVKRLSMAPQWILPVGLVLASIDTAEWAEIAEQALQAGTSAEVRRLLREAHGAD